MAVSKTSAPAIERVERYIHGLGGDDDVFGPMFVEAIGEAYAEALENADRDDYAMTSVPWLERAIRKMGLV